MRKCVKKYALLTLFNALTTIEMNRMRATQETINCKTYAIRNR